MEKPHHFYKISSESETGKRLCAFMQECHDAEEKARLWAKSHGVEIYYESSTGMAGGICAVEFPNTLQKEGWERVETNQGVFFLPEKDSDLEKSMYSLPVVSEVKLIPILNLKPRLSEKTQKPLPFSFGDHTPVVFLHHDCWFVDIPYESGSSDCVSISSKMFYRKRMAETNLRIVE